MENNTIHKILYRSNTNRIIFGVCGGLGEYFDIDPLIFRIIFLVLTFSAGSGLLIYLILAFLIPKNPETKISEKNKDHIDLKMKAQELASELKDLKNPVNEKRRGVARLFLGLLILFFGFGLLAQNLHLIPRYYFDFSIFFGLWPILLILLGLSILSK